MNKQKNSLSDISKTIIVLAIIVLVNILGQALHFRIDLTKEKRYTLSDATETILKDLDEQVFIRIYLDGELNIQLKNFQKSILETVQEFKIHAKSNLQFELEDPFLETDEATRNRIMEELYNKGLRPINIHHRKKDGSVTEKIIIPGAIVSFNGIEIPLNLLLNDPSRSSEENLNNSVEALEYAFISTIKNITSTEVKKVAFLEGHGEWPGIFVDDIMTELTKSYQVDRGSIMGVPGSLNPYECVIIAGPVQKFSEADKYVIDQYIMQGGKTLWLIDAVNVDFDSLARGMTLALNNDINLDDMFFRYGVRLNRELIRDAQCNRIMVNVALAGNKPDFQLAPWVYYPVLTPNKDHVIGNNLNLVLSRFASSIDTIGGRGGITKTPLLKTSEVSGILQIPAIITLDEINKKPKQEDYNSGGIISGVLLEGEFESVFKNRMIDNYFDTPPGNRLEKSEPNRMVIIADADIIRNDIKETERGSAPMPLGFDRATNQTFGNKDFLMNLISYLTGDEGLLELRGREFKLRLLDKNKVLNERLKWQLINLLLPVVFIIMAGIIFSYTRKRRFTR
jgi:gliding-associated putative ABC transporter substrate-binding component GldG